MPEDNNKNDGANTGPRPSLKAKHAVKDGLEKEAVESQGNADAKILAKAYEEFCKDGLTLAERKKIEELDYHLEGADIVVSKDAGSAAIAQDDGKAFTVKPGWSK